MNNENLSIIASIFILSVFILSVIDKMLNFTDRIKSVESKNIPFPFLALTLAILFELFGIIFILFYKFKIIKNKIFLDIGKGLIITFTLLANYYYHNIITMKGQTSAFLKNLGLIGGILLIN